MSNEYSGITFLTRCINADSNQRGKLPAMTATCFVLTQTYFSTAKFSVVELRQSILQVSTSGKFSTTGTQHTYIKRVKNTPPTRLLATGISYPKLVQHLCITDMKFDIRSLYCIFYNPGTPLPNTNSRFHQL